MVDEKDATVQNDLLNELIKERPNIATFTQLGIILQDYINAQILLDENEKFLQTISIFFLGFLGETTVTHCLLLEIQCCSFYGFAMAKNESRVSVYQVIICEEKISNSK